MNRPACSARLAVWGLAATLLTGAAAAAPTRHALIVAVGNYPGLPASSQLEGPANDAQALRDVLVRRWGFDNKNVQVLLDKQAGKRDILAALRGLQTLTQPEDEVLIYFSGHGTSAFSSSTAQGLPLPHTTGAFVAADFKLAPLTAPIRCEGPSPDDGLVVGCRDLRPLIDALDNERTGRRKLWVISDSCYSGQQARSLFGNKRMIPLTADDRVAEQIEDLALAARQAPPPPFPYKRVQFISAAAQGEAASDISASQLKTRSTFDGKPHGAFTDALLGVLEGRLPADFNGDGLISLTELHRAISEHLERQNFAQTPQRLPSVADDERGVANEPVLQVRDVAAKPAGVIASEPLRIKAVGLSAPMMAALRGMPQVSLAADGNADLNVGATSGRLLMLTPAMDFVARFNDSEVDAALRQIMQLAWAKQLRQLAESQRRGALAVEAEPAAQGGNFFLGQTLSFSARPEHTATLLLMTVGADGTVTTLFPITSDEAEPRPAGRLLRMPETCTGLALDDPRRKQACIEVGPPLGIDMVMAFAFDTPPQSLNGLMSLRSARVNDGRLNDFLRELPSLKGRYTFAMIQQRTLTPPKP